MIFFAIHAILCDKATVWGRGMTQFCTQKRIRNCIKSRMRIQGFACVVHLELIVVVLRNFVFIKELCHSRMNCSQLSFFFVQSIPKAGKENYIKIKAT